MNLSSRGRGVAAACSVGAVAVAGGVAVAVHAQGGGAPPVVPVSVDNGKAPVVGPATINAGPTSFKISTTSPTKNDDSPEVIFASLPAGQDPAAVNAKLSKLNGSQDSSKIESALDAAGVNFVGEGHADKGHPTTVTIDDLKAGNYAALNTTSDKKFFVSNFTVGATPNGAVAPAPATTVKMTDYKFAIDGALTRNTTVRFVNAGSTYHMAIPFKVAGKSAAAALVKKLKTAKNPETSLKKYVRGEGKTALGLIGPGGSQDVTVGDKPGAYVFVCFWQSKKSRGKAHFNLGMEKAYTVK